MKRLIAALALVLSAQRLAAQQVHPAVDDRLTGAAALIFNGHGDQARLQLHKAIESYRTDSHPAGEGIALVLLGMADVAANRTAEAANNIDSGVVKLEQAGDSVTAVIGLWMLAEAQLGEGKVDASLATHERALAVLRDAALPTSRFTMDGLRLLGPA